ncbi:hypothetical protein GOV04_04810 [Candidatus Woesearchaeota archaeon]|nr:hypothetical protein [Candidatus Woesearchaeota archaeon]
MVKKTIKKKTKKSAGSDSYHLLAALSYLWILAVPILFFKRNDNFVFFHAKQGTVLFSFSILFFVLALIPLPQNVLTIIFAPLNFLLLVFSLLGVYFALFNKQKNLPLINLITKKF